MENLKISKILKNGYDLRSSDIHIKSNEYIFYRLDGDLNKSNVYTSYEQVMAFLKPLITDEELRNLYDNYIDINKTKTISGIRIRYNIFISMGLPSISIRIVDDKIIDLRSLSIYRDIKMLVEGLNGLILITGVSGSGKTMTLNSIVDYVNNNYSYNILMLEDPIEYEHKTKKSLINQREVYNDTKSYSDGLKSALREDPDIIILGEMRYQS